MQGPESLLSRFLRRTLTRRFPEWVRYASALAMVAATFLLRLAIPFDGLPYLLFIPSLVASSLVFGRGPGLVATFTGALLAVLFLIGPKWSVVLDAKGLFATGLFVAIGIALAILCHTLRLAILRLSRAEREKSLLLDELSHRTKNNLQMVASLLTLQGRTVSDSSARLALDDAAARVQVIAKLHDRLQHDGADALVNMREYLEELCGQLGETLRRVRPVTVRVGAEPIVLGAAVAAPIGLIVNELVTNCFKYAFPDGAEGTVSVVFEAAGHDYSLVVRDNGVGAAPDAKHGLGSRLTGLLVQQLEGRMSRGEGDPGMITTVVIPARTAGWVH